MPSQTSAVESDRFAFWTFVLVTVLTWMIGSLLAVGLHWQPRSFALVAAVGLLLGLAAAVWTGLDPHSN